MSLDRFVSGRLVMLRPEATLSQAARAMEENGIGTVLVGDRGDLVGIVTDRDIVVEAVAHRSDPGTTPLESIMSDLVACVPRDASVHDAVEVMTSHGVRRVPLVDQDGSPVGILSLDDLVAEEVVPPKAAAEVLRAQLFKPTRNKPPGVLGPRGAERSDSPRATRRAAHAETTYARFLHLVMRRTGLEKIEQADRLSRVGVGLLCQRVRTDLARHFLSQLPLLLRESIVDEIDGPDRRVDLAEITDEIADLLRVSPGRAREIFAGLVEALEEAVSPGQIDSVRDQLPPDLRRMFRPFSAGRWAAQTSTGPGPS